MALKLELSSSLFPFSETILLTLRNLEVDLKKDIAVDLEMRFYDSWYSSGPYSHLAKDLDVDHRNDLNVDI